MNPLGDRLGYREFDNFRSEKGHWNLIQAVQDQIIGGPSLILHRALTEGANPHIAWTRDV